MRRPLSAIALVAVLAHPAAAQELAPPDQIPPAAAAPRQVLSANPFGVLLELFNAEYEIRAAEHVTYGVGGSTATVTTYDYTVSATNPFDRREVEREERYVNGDVFLRYYPGGPAFSGFSFGVKAGFTRIPDQGSYFGVGFDANRSWMLNEHFYLGVGGGLKRLLNADPDAFDLTFIPTFRANVGIGF